MKKRDKKIKDNSIYNNKTISKKAQTSPKTIYTDLNGTYIEQNANNSIFVYPNEYDKGRANIAIFNWDNLISVSVDISNIGISIGETYYIHNTLDYYYDVTSGIYDGNPIIIDMRKESHSVARPVGYESVIENSTLPTFGSFVVDKY